MNKAGEKQEQTAQDAVDNYPLTAEELDAIAATRRPPQSWYEEEWEDTF